MTSKQNLVQYANDLISKSMGIIKADGSKDPMIVKDWWGSTPLHYSARTGKSKVISHPLVDKVKDTWGNTPLHNLALAKKSDVLKHPSVDKVKNNNGETPRDLYNKIIED